MWNALSQEPFHITFDVDNGLPSSEIYDITNDANQNIWISTDRGIIKYDGSTFDIYTTLNGLGDNTNFHFNKDKSGRIWCSGFNKSLSYVENDSIKQFDFNFSLKKLLQQTPSNWIKYLKGSSDSFHFVTLNNGIGVEYYEYDKNSFGDIKSTTPFRRTVAEISGKDSTITISNDVFHFYKFGSYNYRVSKAIVDNENDYAIYHGLSELSKLVLSDSSIIQVDLPSRIQMIYLDKKENLWVCTRKGLYQYENADLSKTPKIYFKGLLISCIVEDFQGNYWVGTNDSGIKFVPSFNISNANDNISEAKKESFLSAKIFKDDIVFGSSKSKLLVCKQDEDCKIINVPSKFTNSQINKIEDWGESLMLSTGFKFDGESFVYPPSPNPSITTMQGFKYILRNKDIIITSSSDIFKLFPNPYDTLILSSDFSNPISFNTRTVVQNSTEDIYLGTMNGVFKIKNYDYDNNIEIVDEVGIGLGRVSDILIDKNEIVWVSTIGNGLYAVINDVAIKLNTEEPLINLMLNNLTITNDSLIWLATNDGIDILSYSVDDSLNVKFLRNINKADGLVSTSVNDVEYWNNKIWAATNAGVCNFSTDILDTEVPKVPISITEFINQDSICNFNEELHFKPKQNDIFISYSGLSFQQFSEEVEYKYRLIKDGQVGEEDWYYTKVRSERFNDLPHGSYTFEVNAMNKLGVWNDAPAKVSFVIAPRFVDTLLFKLLMLFLLGFGIYTIIKIVNKRNQTKQQQLLELEEAKTRTQEAEISAIRNQMNPHFVYNSLNSIQNLIFKKDSYGANYYLSKFSTLMRQSLQFTSVNFISLKQEFDFLSDYLELETLRFPNKFKVSFIVDDLIEPSLYLIPSLILQPIVENSIKHGFDDIDYTGIVEIKAELKNDLLHITIKDNGNGVKKARPKNKQRDNSHKSFGTQMVQNRIDLLNRSHFDVQATIDVVQSESGYQTLFILPIMHEND